MKKMLMPLGLLALLLAACVPAATGPEPGDLTGADWQLVNIQYPDGTVSTPSFGEYGISFDAVEGRMFVVADCNSGSAPYEAGKDGGLAFGPIMLTRVACPPGSISDEFVLQLGLTDGFGVTDGFLHLSTRDDAALVFGR